MSVSFFRCPFLVTGGLLLSLLFGGCASPATSQAMIAAPAAFSKGHPEVLAIKVTGGAVTLGMGPSNISDTEFAEAIKSSLTQSGLFTKFSPAEQVAYVLDVQIVTLNHPMMGGALRINLEVTWRLLRRADLNVVWEKSVASSFTATVGDAFAFTTRARLAVEGAARANIKDAIAQMAALTLP